MSTALLPDLWWPPLFCAIGFVVASIVLWLNLGQDSGIARRARAAAEIAVVGGVLYWLVVAHLGWSRLLDQSSYAGGRVFGNFALLEAGVCGLVLWPFAAWRLEKELGVALYDSSWHTARVVIAVSVAFLATYVVLRFGSQGWPW